MLIVMSREPTVIPGRCPVKPGMTTVPTVIPDLIGNLLEDLYNRSLIDSEFRPCRQTERRIVVYSSVMHLID